MITIQLAANYSFFHVCCLESLDCKDWPCDAGSSVDTSPAMAALFSADGNTTGLVAASKAFGVSGVPGLANRNASWVGVLGVSGADRVCVGLRRSCWSGPLRSSSFNWSCWTSATSFSTSGSELDGEIPFDIWKNIGSCSWVFNP